MFFLLVVFMNSTNSELREQLVCAADSATPVNKAARLHHHVRKTVINSIVLVLQKTEKRFSLAQLCTCFLLIPQQNVEFCVNHRQFISLNNFPESALWDAPDSYLCHTIKIRTIKMSWSGLWGKPEGQNTDHKVGYPFLRAQSNDGSHIRWTLSEKDVFVAFLGKRSKCFFRVK